jgi:hypothetical protein
MKKYLLLPFILLFALPVLAQKSDHSYHRALGIKMFPGAISYKKDWG